jgi:hypothetical protein
MMFSPFLTVKTASFFIIALSGYRTMLWIFETPSVSAGAAHALLKNTKEKIRIAAKITFLFIAIASFDVSRFR